MIKEKDYIKELKFLINFDKNFLPCFQRLNYIEYKTKLFDNTIL